MRLADYSPLLRTRFTKMVKFAFIHGQRREGTASVVPNSAPAGRKELSRSLAGGERSEPPDRIGITIRTPAGAAGPPRTPAGARWSGRHGFQGFAKKRSPLAKLPTLLRSGRHD